MVIATGGKAGGVSASGGITTKRQLLSIEGAASSPPQRPRDDLLAHGEPPD